MGAKDVSEKILVAYSDVAADILNVLVCNRQMLFEPEMLQEASGVSQYKMDGKLHHQERDVAKFVIDKATNAIITCCGFENQTKVDNRMPLRVIGYDGASYHNQQNNAELYEVITFVLYFGERHWYAPRNLQGCINRRCDKLPDTVRNDYKINVYEIAYLTQEQIDMFQSDFKYVAEYMVQKRTNKEYQPSSGVIKHVDAVLKLLSAVSGNPNFELIIPDVEEGGLNTMDAMIARFEKRAEARGEARGLNIGENIANTNFATEMIKDGEPVSKIQKYTKLTLDRLEEIAKSLNVKLVM